MVDISLETVRLIMQGKEISITLFKDLIDISSLLVYTDWAVTVLLFFKIIN